MSTWAPWLPGAVIPIALVAVIIVADIAEGPQPDDVGALAVVPILSAVFATPRMTMAVALVTWLSAWAFGALVAEGTASAQQAAAAAETLREQAETDQLTGLVNRHGFLNRVEAEPVDIVRTVALVDCDGLKSVNDARGHQAGDVYLQAIAGRLKGSLSNADLVARWGGDEFLVVQRLDLDRAMTSLTCMHHAVDASPISIGGVMVDASVSVGVAAWLPGTTLDEALARADESLYEAKRQGRNRIVTYP